MLSCRNWPGRTPAFFVEVAQTRPIRGRSAFVVHDFLTTNNYLSPSNFALLDLSRPDVATLIAAMLQARDAVGRRSWSHPQEPTGEGWWVMCSQTRALGCSREECRTAAH